MEDVMAFGSCVGIYNLYRVHETDLYVYSQFFECDGASAAETMRFMGVELLWVGDCWERSEVRG